MAYNQPTAIIIPSPIHMKHHPETMVDKGGWQIYTYIYIHIYIYIYIYTYIYIYGTLEWGCLIWRQNGIAKTVGFMVKINVGFTQCHIQLPFGVGWQPNNLWYWAHWLDHVTAIYRPWVEFINATYCTVAMLSQGLEDDFPRMWLSIWVPYLKFWGCNLVGNMILVDKISPCLWLKQSEGWNIIFHMGVSKIPMDYSHDSHWNGHLEGA